MVSVRAAATDAEGARERLADVAAALAPLEAEGFTVARTSPDQLMVLVPGRDAADVAQALVPAWRRRLEPLRARGVRVMFGVAEAPADGDNAQALMLRAASRSSEAEGLPAMAGPPAPFEAARTASRADAA